MRKFLILIAVFSLVLTEAQRRQVQRATVAFMNVENLWDTIASADYIDGTLPIGHRNFHRSVPIDSLKYLEVTEDYAGPWNDSLLVGKKVIRHQVLADDFTPKSAKNYSGKVYNHKLETLSKVISELGRQYTNSLPTIVGLIEVENRQVIEDLIKKSALANGNYGIIHYNSYDARGIDVALIYQKHRFLPTHSYKKEIVMFDDEGKRSYTRDILIAEGLLDGEKIAVFMNHWPSRSGGEARSAARRNAAAVALKQEMDKIREKDPSVKLFAMGDFNDDPVSPSLRRHLGAVGTEKELSDQSPYLNLMTKLYRAGIASLAYRDAPNLFDQIIVSKNLISSEPLSKQYSIYKAEIYAPDYMINREGQFKGYPKRSWNFDSYTGGYSDHFPAVSVIQREAPSRN
ncbi:endonuclease/exonuclease/phosphatase family protein [Bergeyella sp. RCAD1439]|uniref:endonuclease/exonuclease/phosphatase family protein n=1 Tax=Bergeyella anatis TaxID=3113737 RepID=UPI002E194C45|nr:endonuclease [Bergeyella sp. RCAD1439]